MAGKQSLDARRFVVVHSFGSFSFDSYGAFFLFRRPWLVGGSRDPSRFLLCAAPARLIDVPSGIDEKSAHGGKKNVDSLSFSLGSFWLWGAAGERNRPPQLLVRLFVLASFCSMHVDSQEASVQTVACLLPLAARSFSICCVFSPTRGGDGDGGRQ